MNFRIFENFILFLIFINSLALALYNYADRNSLTYRNQIIDMVEEVLTYAFTLECLMKIVGCGFVLHKKAYLRIGWNIIDFLVVVSG